MTSQINPQNIDGNYPIAGQDNNSQGFRDNFTNIKVNFERAAAEITELQSKTVLTAQLTGSSSSPTNNMNGLPIINMQLQNFRFTGAAQLTNGGTSDLSTTVEYFSTTGASTATLATAPSSKNGQVKIYVARNVTAGAMVLTVADAAWTGSGTITFNANGQSCILLFVDSRWFCIGNNGATFG